MSIWCGNVKNVQKIEIPRWLFEGVARQRKNVHVAQTVIVEFQSLEYFWNTYLHKVGMKAIFNIQKTFLEFVAGLSQAGGLWGLQPLQFLADQLTLSQPGRGHIIPTQYYKPPGFSDLATALRRHYKEYKPWYKNSNVTSERL